MTRQRQVMKVRCDGTVAQPCDDGVVAQLFSSDYGIVVQCATQLRTAARLRRQHSVVVPCSPVKTSKV